MARPGVTYTEVVEAANHLLGQNKNPTIEQIRLKLGTGSSTTIANHLKQWRHDQKETDIIAAKENIPPELIALLKGLWERVISESEIKIRTMQSDHEQITIELQEELQKYKTNNQRWQQLFNQWQQEKAQLTNDKSALEEAVIVFQKEQSTFQSKHDHLMQQLQEKQERITELHQLHAQAQTNLEHYRESAREQRILEQHKYEQQKQELYAEIKILKEQNVALQEKHGALQQQHQAIQQAHQLMEKNSTQTEAQLEKLKTQLIAEEKSNYEQQKSKEHWHHQYNEAQKIVENKTVQFIDLQAEIKVLSQQVSTTQDSLINISEQNKLLSHEKWILAQEKSQLEGQLKQMQKMIAV